jgi:hypothetical protein
MQIMNYASSFYELLVSLISRSSKHLIDLGQLSGTSLLSHGPESFLCLLLLVKGFTLGKTLVLKKVNKLR